MSPSTRIHGQETCVSASISPGVPSKGKWKRYICLDCLPANKEERTGYGEGKKTVWRDTLASDLDCALCLPLRGRRGAPPDGRSTGWVGGVLEAGESQWRNHKLTNLAMGRDETTNSQIWRWGSVTLPTHKSGDGVR